MDKDMEKSHHQPELAMFDAWLRAIEESRTAVQSVDALLRMYGNMLEHIQPHAPGKIGLRFQKNGVEAQTQPTFITYKWTPRTRKQGTMTDYERRKPEGITRQIKRYGPFAGTQEDVRFLVTRIQRLMERRKALVGMLGRFLQMRAVTMQALRKTERAFRDDFRQELSGLTRRHLQRLTDWETAKEAKAREAAQRKAQEVIADPSEPPLSTYAKWPYAPPDDGEETGVLPDTYVDENGNYVGP